MIKLSYFLKEKRFSRRLEKIKLVTKKIIRQRKELNFKKNTNYYLNIVLMDDITMRKLNLKYKKINKTTDVLTFVSECKNKNNKISKYCDVVISSKMVKKYSIKNRLDYYDHFSHLLVHSFLHINGFLHKKRKDFKKMKNLEIKILEKIGLDNPYI